MPRPRGARHCYSRGEIPINGSGALARSSRFGIILDLHFIAPAQIDAAVGSGRVVEFDVQAEIVVCPNALQVRSPVRADQRTLRDAPFTCCRTAHPPAGEITVVEQAGRASFNQSLSAAQR